MLDMDPSEKDGLSIALSEMSASDFSLISCDISDEKCFAFALQLAKAHKSAKKDSVLILSIASDPIETDLFAILEENFDHIIRNPEPNLSLFLPVQMIASACQPGFIGIDVFDVIRVFKQFRYSLLDAAGCTSMRDINDFLWYWTRINKKYCGEISFQTQAILLHLLIDAERGDLETAETVITAIDKTFVREECEIIPFGQFVSQRDFLEISMLLMSKERWTGN